MSNDNKTAAGITTANLAELERLCRSFDRVPHPRVAFIPALETLRRLCGAGNLQGYLYDKARAVFEPMQPVDGEPLTALSMSGHQIKLLTGGGDRLDSGPLKLGSLSQSDPWWEFFQQNREAIASNRIAAIVPLTSAREVLGLVALEEEDCGKKDDPATAQLLQLGTSQIALGLSHLELISKVRRTSFQGRLKTLELETLQDMGVAFAGSLDLQQLTGELLVRVISVVNVNRAAILLDRSPDRREEAGDFSLETVESFGFEENESGLFDSLFECGDVYGNLADNVPTIVNETELAVKVGCRNLIVVPVHYKGQLLGAILAGDKESRTEKNPPFTDDDLRLLSSMAGQAGAAISNARLYRDVLRMKNFNENILASIASGVVTTDSRGRVVSFNDSASRIFALPAAEATGLPLGELLGGLGLEELARKLADVTGGGEHFQEMNVQGINYAGGPVVLNISATPLGADEEDGDGGGIVVSVENVSEGARIKDTLRRYVSSNVVDMVLAEGHELVLGGKLCEVTVLFADIRGFTSLSEQLTPGQVVEMLNGYFDLIIDVVFRYNGTVDKIVGDEIMVLFGAPFPLEDDTERAVNCAMDMLATLEKLNVQRAEAGESPLRIGIGLNRGGVISGNIGSTRHMDYTVIGDAVNLASRLVDNATAGQILVTRSVADGLGASFGCRRIGEIKVKGKQKPVEVFEVAGGQK